MGRVWVRTQGYRHIWVIINIITKTVFIFTASRLHQLWHKKNTRTHENISICFAIVFLFLFTQCSFIFLTKYTHHIEIAKSNKNKLFVTFKLFCIGSGAKYEGRYMWSGPRLAVYSDGAHCNYIRSLYARCALCTFTEIM